MPYPMPGSPNPMMGASTVGGGPGPETLKDPSQQVGEELVTKLLSMAASNPQMMMGLALASAGREISQLTGLSKSRSNKTKNGAMPPAQALLSGNSGDIDRMLALQAIMAQGGQSPMRQPAIGPPSPLAGLIGPPGPPPGMAQAPPLPPPGLVPNRPLPPPVNVAGPAPSGLNPVMLAALQRSRGVV